MPDVDLPAAAAVPGRHLPASAMHQQRLPLRGPCSREDERCGDPGLPAALHAQRRALPPTVWRHCNAMPPALRGWHRYVPAASVPCRGLVPMPGHRRAVPLPRRCHVRARAVHEWLPAAPTSGAVHHVVPTPPVPDGGGDRVPTVHGGEGHRLPSRLTGDVSSRRRQFAAREALRSV
jgi:hypothetical protein